MTKIGIQFDSEELRKSQEVLNSSEDEYSDEEVNKRSNKRKPKTIKDIIEMIYIWNQLMKGIPSFKDGQPVQFKPKEASEVLGLPLKTIYDYKYFLK